MLANKTDHVIVANRREQLQVSNSIDANTTTQIVQNTSTLGRVLRHVLGAQEPRIDTYKRVLHGHRVVHGSSFSTNNRSTQQVCQVVQRVLLALSFDLVAKCQVQHHSLLFKFRPNRQVPLAHIGLL